MKKKLHKWLCVLAFALSLASISGSALAYCQWMPGHWRHGMWIPAHRVCGGGYYYRTGYGCRWMPAHWRYGVWYPARRVCW